MQTVELFAWPTAGAWPDWFAAFGTVLSFGFGAWVYGRSQRDTEKSQARFVHAYIPDISSLTDGEIASFSGEFAQMRDNQFEVSFSEDGDSQFYAIGALLVVDVKIENNSDELITKLTPTLFLEVDGEVVDHELPDIPFLLPKSSEYRHLVFDMGKIPRGEKWAAVDFTDATGRHWHRDQRHPLRRR